MELAPMRFKTFVWPHNPRVYAIRFQRKLALHKIPFGRHLLQSLGQTCRVFQGEGEFVGADAYDTFKKLATVFHEESPGPLVHPVWMSTRAWFVSLRLEEEPRPDYVRYSFEFWEVLDIPVQTGLTERKTDNGGSDTAPGGTGAAESAGGQTPVWHTVAKGDTLWAIARRYSTTVAAIVALNPDLRNPNLILPGQKVRVR